MYFSFHQHTPFFLIKSFDSEELFTVVYLFPIFHGGLFISGYLLTFKHLNMHNKMRRISSPNFNNFNLHDTMFASLCVFYIPGAPPISFIYVTLVRVLSSRATYFQHFEISLISISLVSVSFDYFLSIFVVPHAIY